SDKVVTILISLLQDEDSNVCYRAAESLGRLKSSGQAEQSEQITAQVFDEVLNKLFETLHNVNNLQVLRRNAARLLGRIGPLGERTSHALLQGLLDPDSEVRVACANGL